MARIFQVTMFVAALLWIPGGKLAGQQDTLPPASNEKQQETSTSPADFDAESLVEKASYLIGYNIVQDLRSNPLDLNDEQFLKGIRDALEGKQPPMSDEEIVTVMETFRRAMVRKQEEMMAKIADENQRAGMEFMKKNALEDGVKELENGVQYRVIEEGSGEESPRLTDRVKVNYKGKFLDGTVFDASPDGSPATFNVGGVIRGFSTALQNMKAGDKWTVFIPADLAYGPRGNPPVVGPNQTLIFELELLEIVR